MCKELCDEPEDGSTCCQDCGRMICWDTETEDDVCAPAAASASGDLYCSRCARSHDEAEELEDDGEYFDDFDEFDYVEDV